MTKQKLKEQREVFCDQVDRLRRPAKRLCPFLERYYIGMPIENWKQARQKELSNISFRSWHMAICQWHDGKGHPRYRLW